MIVDRAVYRDGRRTAEPDDFAELHAACKAGDAVAWLGLFEPDAEEFSAMAREFDLHELAVEDAVKAHQRPKLERYGDTLFLVVRPARYVDETETVLFGEVAIFVGPQFVITVRHGDAPELGPVRRRLEARPELLRRGPMAILYAIVDHVVDGYAPVVAGLEHDIDEIEDEVFGGSPTVSRRIYELSREVIEFQRVTSPLEDILGRLGKEAGIGDEEGRYLRDVQDHAIRAKEQADAFRALLENILSVNLTLETKALSESSHAQSEQVKRISAWAAILFAPTLVGTTYGMNFDHMPELHWTLGYPFALALMLLVSVGLYVVFKRHRWI
ncbi:MAG TPA: magnesium and cobalt transport protein CorA [Gaiellaceae bacterium]|jgi:magnesium transporter|nr:magnesium and cobalt transport protein CorA [Gaiellaceae bacterium]